MTQTKPEPVSLRQQVEYDLFEAAHRYLRGELDAAARAYLRVLKVDPTHAEARAGLAHVFLLMGLPGEAVALLKTEE